MPFIAQAAERLRAQKKAGLLRQSVQVGLCLAVTLAVCSAPAAAQRQAPGYVRPYTSLRVWYGTDDPVEGAMAQILARRFMAMQPSVHVTLTTYSLDDLNQKMQLALGAATGPDLVYTTPRGPGLPAYVRAGKLRDLTTEARRHGWAKRLRSGLLAAYNALLAPRGRSTRHIYAVPYSMAAVGLLYNKALFRRLQLSLPHTLAALEQEMARIKRAGYTPLGLGNADGWIGDDWWISLVNARVGPDKLASALRLDPHFTFRTPVFMAEAARLQRWVRQGYVTRNFGGLDAQDSVEAFFEGRTALQLISSTENAQILALSRQRRLDVGVIPFPAYGAHQVPVMVQSGYEGWAIPRFSHNIGAALQWIDAMTSAQTIALLLSYGLIPAHPVRSARDAVIPFQAEYLQALARARPGVYLDAIPVPNLNATMEAHIQLLLQNDEMPVTLLSSLQEVYRSYGVNATQTRTDGEF